MKTRETIVIVSQDGKRAVGKSFVVNDGEPEKGAPEVEENVKALDRRLQSTINSYARDCDKDAIDYAREIEHFSGRAERLSSKIKRFTIKGENLQERIDFWKQTGTIATVVLSILGLIGGIFISITEWLKFHGPTESVADTIIAFLVYCVSGIILCIILGWLAKTVTNRKIKRYREMFDRNKELLTELISEEETCSQKVEKYCKLREEKIKKARQIRGLL